MCRARSGNLFCQGVCGVENAAILSICTVKVGIAEVTDCGRAIFSCHSAKLQRENLQRRPLAPDERLRPEGT